MDTAQPDQEVHSTVPPTSNTQHQNPSDDGQMPQETPEISEHLTTFEKANNFILASNEYVDVLMKCKLDVVLVDPVTNRGIRFVGTQTNIQKKIKPIPLSKFPFSKTGIGQVVEFKREVFPMETE